MTETGADALARLEAMISGMSDAEKRDLDKLIGPELAKPWRPVPGPQLQAYTCQADLLLYGGAAGGGKSELIAGLALCEHERSLILRRQASDLDGFWERLLEIGASIKLSNDGNKKRLKTKDKRVIEGGHLERPGSELSWQGRPHDFIGFDEGAQLDEAKVTFVLGWLRSATGRRCRAVIATNPPIGGEGAWIIEWFAPWLDPMFPEPADPGELRWCYQRQDGNRLVTVWCDRDANIKDEEGRSIDLQSRTFIPSKLDDNPYLRDTGYRARINAMPEPLRSQLLFGDFMAGREDDEYQVIPSAWVDAAQARWTEDGRRGRMMAIAADIAQGGKDKTAIASLHEGNWFGPLHSILGEETPDGPSAAAFILKHRRDGAAIAIDMTGGWGGSARDTLRTHHGIESIPIVFSAGSTQRDPATNFGYANLRAEMWWEFRRALDPSSTEPVAIPPGQRIKAQLCSARWMPRSGAILVESKDDIRKRLGSSTDDADALIMAWKIRKRAALSAINGGVIGQTIKSTKAKVGYSKVKARYR